jgi:CheY-like chemotaxis protein
MRRRVLVVEDNPANSELLCDWLEAEGIEAVPAENLEQAFAALKNQQPDAVLLDVQLETEDGLSLAAWMRKEPVFRSISVIAVTAHAMVTDQERIIRAGCDVCISKPVDFKVLRVELRRWMEHGAKLQREDANHAEISTTKR